MIIRPLKKGIDMEGFRELGFSIIPEGFSEIPIPMINGKYNLQWETHQKEKEEFEKQFGFTFESAEGRDFLDNFVIRIDHDETIMPDTTLTKFAKYVIEVNNGFGFIKYDGYKEGAVDTTRFELYDENTEITNRVTRKTLINTAIAEFQTLWETKRPLITLIARYIFDANSGIKTDIAAYDKLSIFIEEYDGAKKFLSAAKENPETMDLVVTVKEAILKNIIRLDKHNYINYATKNVLGRNFDEVVAFLGDPANQDEMGLGTTDDASYSIKAQLKNANR